MKDFKERFTELSQQLYQLRNDVNGLMKAAGNNAGSNVQMNELKGVNHLKKNSNSSNNA